VLAVHRSVFLNFVRPGPACIAALATGLLAQVIAGSTAVAQSESRVLADPPPRAIQQGKAPRDTMMAAPSAANLRTEKQLDLNVVYADSQIYNPGTGRSDKVRLRSYAGSSVNPNAPYVAPTIEVDPGDTVRITLNNKLPADPSCTAMHEDPNNLGEEPDSAGRLSQGNLHARDPDALPALYRGIRAPLPHSRS